MNFHWVTVVWGEKYTELYINLIIPSQLSTGNIPALKHRHQSTYKIYAPAAEIEVIRHSACFERLASLIPVQFIDIAGVDRAILAAWPYDVMTRCHTHAHGEAVAAGAGIIYLGPDAILCDGSFAALERRALEGHKILLISSLMAALEAGRPWIEGRCREADGSIRLTARQAAQLMRRHPQSLLEKLAVTDREFANPWPSSMWVPVAQDSMVYRAWHLHPIFVKTGRGAALTNTVDSGQFLEDAATKGDSFFLFDDADEFCAVELSAYDQRGAAYLRDLQPFTADKVAAWVGEHTGMAGRALARRSILYNGGDATAEAVEAADRILSAHIDAVLDRVATRPSSIRPVLAVSDIERTVPTYFYGAGQLGRELLQAMGGGEDWNFLGFVDTHRHGICDGFPMLDLERFKAVYRPGDQVVITSMYVREIAETLVGIDIFDVKEARSWHQACQHVERVRELAFRALPLEGYVS